MHRIRTLVVTAIMALAVALPTSNAMAQDEKSLRDELVGSWSLVSLVADVQGRNIDVFGPNPIGRMILDANGNFATLTLRSSLPHFASNNRMQGTPEEYRAIAQGSNAFFGTYNVNEVDKTIDFHIEFATFPNWNGDLQKRVFKLEGDQLSYVNPATTVGPGNVNVVWKRALTPPADRYECKNGKCYGSY